MPHFSYLGDHASVTLWGIDFPRGVAVAVEDAHAIGKLRGNSHFVESFDGVEVFIDNKPREDIKRKPGRPRKDA